MFIKENKIKHCFLKFALAVCASFSVLGLSIAQEAPVFSEGLLETKISMYGVDLSPLTEATASAKDNIQDPMKALKDRVPAEKLEALQTKLKGNPMMGLAMLLLPPKGSIYLRKDAALARIYGLGYYMEHSHNLQTDEGIIYMSSQAQPEKEATASYHPSEGYDKVFSGDRLIHPDQFTITKENGTFTVAGHPCQRSVYTARNLTAPASATLPGMPAPQLHKLVVYTSDRISKSINFSHPYYLPEEHGILRIDAYYDDGNEPSAVYEVTAVKPQIVTDELLAIKKSEPLYKIDDVQYGMKVMEIMFGGLSALTSTAAEGADEEQ